MTISSSGAPLSGLAVGTISYGAGQPTGWLTTATLSSTTSAATLTMGATPGSLPVGSYKATIPVTATGAGNNPQVAKVTLNVVAAPWLTVTPNLRNFFGPVGGAVPASKIINISNTGTAGTTLSGLTVSSITYAAGQPAGWLTTAALSSTTAPSTLTLMPAVGALPPGLYSATVAVASPWRSRAW